GHLVSRDAPARVRLWALREPCVDHCTRHRRCVRMTPSPMDPEIAAALLSQHLDDFFMHSPKVANCPDDWCRHESGDPIEAIVGIPAKVLAPEEPRSTYHVLLDATYYDSWPLKMTFV